MPSFENVSQVKLCFRREPVCLAAVELLGQAYASITLEATRSRNLASAQFYLPSKLAVQSEHKTDGKFRVF